MKSLLPTLRTYSIITLITLGMIEIVLQIAHIKGLQGNNTIKHLYTVSDRETYVNAACDSGWWKWKYVQYYEENQQQIGTQNIHIPHETRGWKPKPNLSIKIAGNQYTTNNRGHRSLKDYQANSEKYTILIVGDSYTFGEDTDDAYVWPTLLQNLDPRFNVINLGVQGYGLDQMYITLKESITQYNPDLVIAAFISDDLFRMRFDFRDYKKPKLQLNNGEIKIMNTPIKGLEETYQETKAEIFWYNIPLLKLDNLLSNLKISCREVGYELPSQVFLEMAEISQQENAEFLLTYLASSPEVENQDHISYGEKVLKQFIEEHPQVNVFNTRPFFLEGNAQGKNYQGGHYQQKEAKLVSEMVEEKIKTLDSWEEFLK